MTINPSIPGCTYAVRAYATTSSGTAYGDLITFKTKPLKDGVDGINGVNGSNGAPGTRGDKGDKGDQGDKGDKGDKGETGDKGDEGKEGRVGPEGPRGPQIPNLLIRGVSISIGNDVVVNYNSIEVNVLIEGNTELPALKIEVFYRKKDSKNTPYTNWSTKSLSKVSSSSLITLTDLDTDTDYEVAAGVSNYAGMMITNVKAIRTTTKW